MTVNTHTSAHLGLGKMSGFVSSSAAFFSPAEQMFWEVMRLRREMTTARLGFYMADQG